MNQSVNTKHAFGIKQFWQGNHTLTFLKMSLNPNSLSISSRILQRSCQIKKLHHTTKLDYKQIYSLFNLQCNLVVHHGSPDLSSSPQESQHTLHVPTNKSMLLAKNSILFAADISKNPCMKKTFKAKTIEHTKRKYLWANFSARTGASGTDVSLSARSLQQKKRKRKKLLEHWKAYVFYIHY